MQGTGQGCFVFSWDQVELDGLAGSPPITMHAGANWRWYGDAMRIDDRADVLRLQPGRDAARVHDAAAARAQRLLGRPGPDDGDADNEVDGPRRSFRLTDGIEVHEATLIGARHGGRPLVMFSGAMPAAERDYWVLSADIAEPGSPPGNGMICFVPGTLLQTPEGVRPVENIRAGDRVSTRDDGPQEVLWRASRRLSGCRIIAMPEQRPIRIRAGQFGSGNPRPALYVSPDHRVLLAGLPARELFGSDEVLVAARDLVGQQGISVDNRPQPVEYIHLMLARHQVLCANGVFCESFHPASADLQALQAGEREELQKLVPQVVRDPMRFGIHARRILSRAEAALMLYGLGRGVAVAAT